MSQPLFELNTEYPPAGDQPRAIAALQEGIQNGLFHQTLLGVTGSGKTYTMAHVIASEQRPALILAHNKTLAAQLYSEMKAFFPKNAVEYFVSYYDYYQPEAYVPASDTYIEKEASINDSIEQLRLSATKSILERRDCIIVATVSAIYGLGDKESYLSMLLHVRANDKIDRKWMLHKLNELQYSRNDLEFRRGTYRIRGDTVDIFPADSSQHAIRIESFGDEVEKIQSFDPLTGRILQHHPRITIFPKSHYVTPRARILGSVEFIKAECKLQVAHFEAQQAWIEAQRIAQRTQYDIEMLLEIGYCNGIENYSRYLSGRAAGEPPPTLFDYLPKDALLFIDESHVTVPQLGAMYKGDRARKENLVQYGFRLPSALDNRPLKFEEFEALQPQTIYVSATPGSRELALSGAIVEQIVRPTGLLDPLIEVRPVASQVDDALSEIRQRVAQRERVLITTLTKKMSEDLTNYLAEHGVKVRYLHSDIGTIERAQLLRGLRQGDFDVLIGINLLREGLDLPEVSLVAIFDADKEGFLRSPRSLVQTIGRAARNQGGLVLMYADVITTAMETAISETTRRRKIQMAYNKQHGITPKTVVKPVRDLLDWEAELEQQKKRAPSKKERAKALDAMALADQLEAMYPTVASLKKAIAAHEKKMRLHAQNMEFEEAARTRDHLRALSALLAQQEMEDR